MPWTADAPVPIVRVIGLTGGIASGKSLVCRFLRDLGARVIDADAVARDIVAPGGPILRQIIEAFGQSVAQADGTLNRKALAARIFSDPEARRTLNALMHPAIRERIAQMIEALRIEQPDAVVVVEIPLLLDTTSPEAYRLDGVTVVHVDEATQVSRLVARDGLTEEAARRRLASQRPLREKLSAATWIIDNSGSPETTRRQVEDLWRAWSAGP